MLRKLNQMNLASGISRKQIPKHEMDQLLNNKIMSMELCSRMCLKNSLENSLSLKLLVSIPILQPWAVIINIFTGTFPKQNW